MFDSAIADYEKAILLNDKDFEVYDWKSSAEISTTKYNDALSDSERAINLNNKRAPLYFRKASILCSLGKKAKAIATLKKGNSYTEDKSELVESCCCINLEPKQ